MGSEFGALVKRLRREAGLTQEQLAERSQLGVRTIHRLENGAPADVRLGTVRRVAVALAEVLNQDADAVWERLSAAQAGRPVVSAVGSVGSARSAGAESAVLPASATAPAGIDVAVPPASASTPAGSEPSAPTPALASATAARAAAPVSRPPIRFAPHDDDPLATHADSLAREIYGRWIREEEQRRVHDPMPLPVRWRQVPDGRAGHADGVTSGVLSSGVLSEIAATYRAVPGHRLVVLGPAGAGKTVLLLRFVLDHISTRSAEEPVPLLIGLAAWDPEASSLRDWLISGLLQEHPNLAAPADGGRTLAASLVDAGWILPVLDGFDEIAESRRAAALRELNATSLPLLLASRPDQFGAAAGTASLHHAVAIEILPLGTEDLAGYLPHTSSRLQAWDPVLKCLREQPDDPAVVRLTTVLGTPLMVLLARSLYGDGSGQDPRELLDPDRFPSITDVEDHLLAGFVPTVYASRPAQGGRVWQPQQYRRYLHHLAGYPQDISWWQLPRAFSGTARLISVIICCAILVPIADVALLPLITMILPGIAADTDRVTVLDAVFYGPVAGTVFGLMHNAYLRHGSGVIEPSRVSLRLPRRHGPHSAGHRRRTMRLAAVGGLAGAAVGVMYRIGGLALRPSTVSLDAALRALPAGALIFALMFGLTGCTTLGLLTALEVPVDPASAATPEHLLASNRRTTLARVVLMIGLFTALFVGVGWLVVLALQPLFGPLTWNNTIGLGIGLETAIIGGCCYIVAFTAWGQWLLFGRLLLPLRGRLPWAPLAFLQDAYRRGVLRRSGAVYQFRHARLREQLQKPPRSVNSAAASPTASPLVKEA